MTVHLDNDLIPSSSATKTEKLLAMKRRQRVLCLKAKELLSARGYAFGDSLKVPGAFGYEATTPSAAKTTIGFKTSSDRWLGVSRNSTGGWGLLDACETVFVITFDDPHAPKRLQVFEFDSEMIINTAIQVYAQADAEQQTGIQFIPLDDHDNKDRAAMAAGHLLQHGTLIFDEQIDWSGAPEPTPMPPTGDGEGTIRPLTMAQAKAGLAVAFGVDAESIKITING